MSEKSICVSNDVFDELFAENQRLLNELLFANKCLNKFRFYLNKILEKYDSVIDSIDKQVLNEFVVKYNCIESKTNEEISEKVIIKSEPNLSEFSDDSIGSVVQNSDEFLDKNQNKLKSKRNRKSNPNSMASQLKEKCFDSTTNSYNCPKTDCEKWFPNHKYLRNHLRRVHKNADILCEFPNCDKRFKTRHDLTKHVFTHNDIKPFGCDFPECGYRCKTRTNLEIHMKRHFDYRPFECTQCAKTFKFLSALKTHDRVHRSEPTIVCKSIGCNQMFYNDYSLYKHNISEHNMKPKMRTKRVRIKSTVAIACDWPGCEFRANCDYRLKIHKRIHTGEKTYVCDWPECGKGFRLNVSLKDHKNIHYNLKPYVCHWPGCGYQCSSAPNLNKHLRKHKNLINGNN